MCRHLLVVGKQIEEVEAKDGVLPLRFANDGIKFVIVALEDADVSLELCDVLLFDREECSKLVDLAYATIVG